MTVYQSGGLPYVGTWVWRGTTGEYPPAGWTKINEVYELTDFTRTWDQVDFTSHESWDKHFTRTSKPGLLGLVTVTFRGIWLDAEHEWLDGKFNQRESWPFKFSYEFTEGPTDPPKAYGGMAWIGEYVLSGDLGDKFVYSVTLVFDGEPQPL